MDSNYAYNLYDIRECGAAHKFTLFELTTRAASNISRQTLILGRRRILQAWGSELVRKVNMPHKQKRPVCRLTTTQTKIGCKKKMCRNEAEVVRGKVSSLSGDQEEKFHNHR